MNRAQPLNKAEEIGIGENNLAYRELAFNHLEKGHYNLWMTFVDQQANYTPELQNALEQRIPGLKENPEQYRIPLARSISTQDKDTDPDYQLELMPVFPLRMTTPLGHELDHLRDGWLYIFRNGHLWREIEVRRQIFVNFIDVNLGTEQGKDERRATVQAQSRIVVVPNSPNDELDFAYSEIQWSWAYIQKLGGMHPDDPRYIDSLAIHEPFKAIRKDNDLYNKRLQRIRLNDYNPVIATSHSKTPEQAAQYFRQTGYLPVESAYQHNKNELFQLKTKLTGYKDVISGKINKKADDLASELPAIILQDPLAIAMDNIEAWYDKKTELVAEIKEIEKHEHHKSAVTAYHTFFNKDLWKTGKRTITAKYIDHEIDVYEIDVYSDDSDSSHILRKAATDIDKPYLERILRVSQRKKIRQDMRNIKRRHALWLDGKIIDDRQAWNSTAKDAAGHYRYFLPINTVLVDYATLPAPAYLQLWSTFNGLAHFLNLDPSTIDSAYDLKKNTGKLSPAEDAGVQCLANILNKDNPYHKLLFPGESQVDVYNPDYQVDKENPEHDSKQGEFRPAAFAASIMAANSHQMAQWKKLSAVIKQAEKIVSSFILIFRRQWEMAQKTKVTYSTDVLIRIGKAADTDDLKSMHKIKKGSALKNVTVLDGSFSIYPGLKKHFSNPKFDKPVSDPGKHFANILDPVTGKPLFSMPISEIGNVRGLPLQFTQQDFKQLLRAKVGDSFTARADLVVSGKVSPYTEKWFIPDIDSSAKVANRIKALRIGNATLPPLVAVFEVLNFNNALNNFNKNDPKSYAQILLGLISLVYATIDASTKMLPEERAINAWGKLMGRDRADKLIRKQNHKKLAELGAHSKLGLLGAGLTGISAIMAGWDMMDAFSADDDDAAIAYGMQMVAGIGLMMAEIGAASSAEAGLLFIMGPWAPAFLALMILAGILAFLLTDTPLEKWAKHGPFALDQDDRLTEEYARMVKASNGEMKEQPKTPKEVHEALMTLLMAPQVKITVDRSTTPPTTVVDVTAPGFKPGKSSIRVHATSTEGSRSGRRGIRWTGQQITLPCISWKPLVRDKNPNNTYGIQYRFKLSNHEIQLIKARAQHETEDQAHIPTWPDKPVDKTADPVIIDDKINGWAYAKPVTIR